MRMNLAGLAGNVGRCTSAGARLLVAGFMQQACSSLPQAKFSGSASCHDQLATARAMEGIRGDHDGGDGAVVVSCMRRKEQESRVKQKQHAVLQAGIRSGGGGHPDE